MEGTGKVVGRKAPEFSLADEKGETRTLDEFLANGPLMVVFYPGDFTPVCTKQLCNYRDSQEDFSNLGIQVVGISRNPPESHAKFKETYQLPFPLLSDSKSLVARAFGCTSKLLFGAVTRAVYIINSKGVILYEYVEPTPLTRRKSDELVGVLKDLKTAALI